MKTNGSAMDHFASLRLGLEISSCYVGNLVEMMAVCRDMGEPEYSITWYNLTTWDGETGAEMAMEVDTQHALHGRSPWTKVEPRSNLNI